MWRYQVCQQTKIIAPVGEVYDIASNPELVPSYAPEIARIVVLKNVDEHTALVRSYLKVARLNFAFLYRYHYRRPVRYSGVQEDGRLLRGYFNLAFEPDGDATLVSHTEGLLSPIPFLAWMAGLLYFRVFSRGGMHEELGRLKRMVEGRASSESIGGPER